MECIFCCSQDVRPKGPAESLSVPVEPPQPQASKAEASGKAVLKVVDDPVKPTAGPKEEPAKQQLQQQSLQSPPQEPKCEEKATDAEKVAWKEHQQEEFEIALDLERELGKETGLDWDGSDGETLLVLAVRRGPFEDWNNAHDAKARVKHLDRIVEVNGISGNSPRMETTLKSCKNLRLRLRRPKEFIVQLDKAGRGRTAKIGLDITHSAMESLHIKRVKEGLVNEWNSMHPELKVENGDRIIEVNKVRGDSQRLLEVISTEDELQLLVHRA
eukprot:TRINITY_DN102122_c0_g1_i1.p1 TRINITY_DN102122_c0_g1~~TRINITY_DN102122_c0_g1_i1.p1  ORF type:complete len:272 (-),score=76.98 TRINITY_DN102122_c0_g1_i1:167-982(-)